MIDWLIGRHFNVLEHQYGRRDVMWKRFIRKSTQKWKQTRSFQICFADKRRRKHTSYAVSKPLRRTDIISIAQPLSDAIKVFFFFSSPDVEWKKQSLLLHAIYLSVISLLVALNILLVVRRWRKPHVKGNWHNFFSAK